MGTFTTISEQTIDGQGNSGSQGIVTVKGIVMVKAIIMEKSQRKDQVKMQISQEIPTKTMRKTRA